MAEHARLDRLLMELHRGFGFRNWWPAETPFEVIAGAILTQNTAWSNVEKALSGLKALGPLSPGRILATREERLARAIRSSGYYRVKAKKLLAVSRWYLAAGGLAALRERPLGGLREELLGVWGVGPETADSILCYAAGRRTAVVDAYTRRVLSRHGFLAYGAPYEVIRRWLGERLVPSQFVYEEFHALLVRAGYENCKPSPACQACPATTPRALRAAGSRPARAARTKEAIMPPAAELQ
jgi:endonuclease-3 related protein